MLTITVSEPVWQAIASRGKFGETEDDVLRRVFNLPANPKTNAGEQTPKSPILRAKETVPRRSRATNKLSSYISGNELRVSFASGQSNSWVLPSKSDKNALRLIREKAAAFAEKHGATLGQVNAVRKTLTDSGFHLLK